jgi:hypothetical protein
VRDFVVHLFRAGLVHNVASDTHDDDVRRAQLHWGFERMEAELPGITEQAPWFTETAPTAIVSGVTVPAPPDPPAPKRAWLRMRRSAG